MGVLLPLALPSSLLPLLPFTPVQVAICEYRTLISITDKAYFDSKYHTPYCKNINYHLDYTRALFAGTFSLIQCSFNKTNILQRA